MDTHPLPPDDVNSVERRLSAWQPSETGLTPDAMLFAAGRASARAGRAWLVWPVISTCLAALTVTLSVWLASERSERLALARQLQQRLAEPAPSSDTVPSESPTADEALAPDGYLILRREWEQHPGDWTVRPAAPGNAPKGRASPESPILRAWQPAGPAEPL